MYGVPIFFYRNFFVANSNLQCIIIFIYLKAASAILIIARYNYPTIQHLPLNVYEFMPSIMFNNLNKRADNRVD